jgi:hypothetical protein
MKSSSAAGLFQFIDQTWLGTLKQAGPAFGYGNYANAISRYASGHYSVDDPDMRRQIMKLRNDPTANSVMGRADPEECRRPAAPDRAPAARRRALCRPFPRGGRCRQAHPSARYTASINHKIYGERFVKPRDLACYLSGPVAGLRKAAS